jgi:hypothetical protein
VPHVDILSNKYAMMAESQYGAHCDFYSSHKEDGKTKHRRFTPEIIVKYLDEVSKFNQKEYIAKMNKERIL